MILTVTLNASIDKRYVLEEFDVGEVNRLRECRYTAGGKGLNVSRVAKTAGCDVTAAGFVGGHAGAYIEEVLGKTGVVCAFYHAKEESRSCVNIWDEKNKRQTELLEPGLTVKEEELKGFLEQYKKIIEKADVIAISGSVPKGVDATVYPTLIEAAKRAGKKVILDTSGELLSEGIKAKPSLIKPNIDEIRMLTGKNCDDMKEVLQAAKEIQNSGVETVAVSLGAKGSLMVCRQGAYRAAVPKLLTVNSVGCGDSMIAGFALGLEQGLDPEEMLKKASAISAAAALQEETGAIDMKDVERIYPKVQIEKIK